MTHALHDYLAEQLGDLLAKRSIIVFYDPRKEFLPFFDELTADGSVDRLTSVILAGSEVSLARYRGSYFQVRATAEPIVQEPTPDKLLVYVPGKTRDREASVLMELELGGGCYEPQLKRLARHLLQRSFSDAQIDGLLNRDGVTYQDVVAFLAQVPTDGAASALRAIFDNAKNDDILVTWTAYDERDQAIVEKQATRELVELIQLRLGLALDDGASLAETRRKTSAYILVNEFRSDLSCDSPTSCAGVPVAPSADQLSAVRYVAAKLRADHAEAYIALAGRVETDLGLAGAPVDAACLGAVDTFRFEERSLLWHAGELIRAKDYGRAAAIVEGRRHSFWADRDVARQAQWEACRLMSDLGVAVERVRAEVTRFKGRPSAWVAAYSGPSGWLEADALHRRLESLVARMSDDPESEEPLAVVEREHEELLKLMAERYTEALEAADWLIEDTLSQTRVYTEMVNLKAGATAYFLVDALRYEMGVDLLRQIDAALDAELRPAAAALPSITQVGMAAALPGANASFSVLDEHGRLAARIGEDSMTSVPDRMKHLMAEVPGAVELKLSDVLQFSKAGLAKAIAGAPLVVVRSQELDALGENADDLVARQLMEAVIGNVVRAVNKLALVGLGRFVITADHGHQFALRKEDDMKTDSPGGETLALHRRCWVGRGGATPPGCVRVSGPQLGYDTDLDFVFPVGLGVFKAGGGLSYHHGGLSLQETVIPVITFRMATGEPKAASSETASLIELPDAITNRLFPVRFVIQSLLAEEPLRVRLLLLHGEEEAGAAGMATGAELDNATGIIRVTPNTEVSVVMMLANDEVASVKIVLQDVRTDAVLAQSHDIPVKLGV